MTSVDYDPVVRMLGTKLLDGIDDDVFMSPSLQDRIDPESIINDVPRANRITCKLLHSEGELVGRLCAVVTSKRLYEISIMLDTQMLQESLDSSEFNKVVILMDGNKVSHSDIQGSWCQRKDIIINEYTGEINLVLSVIQEDT